MKRWKVDKGLFTLIGLLLLAILLRLALISQNWPTTNSDEATMDLMALHILSRGEHPVFFYGQAYMGSFEAYIGALCFRLFGVSLFALRVGLLPLVALFLLALYRLTCLLYQRAFALFVVALLAVGSADSMLHQLKAIGGYPETLLFAALIFLLSSQLVLSRAQISSSRTKRSLTYLLLGLLTGFSLYTDPLLLPFIATSALLLLLFCSHELRSRSGLLLLLGLLLGLLPFILYNARHLYDYSSFNAYLDIQASGKRQLLQQHVPPIRMLLGALLVALPLALGITPACSPQTMPLFGPATPNTALCVFWHGSWTLGYWLLWLLSTLLTLRALWYFWHEKKSISLLLADANFSLYTIRLLLLASTALCFLLYVLNPESALDPAPTTRYLLCMLIGTPALLWPLWQPLTALASSLHEPRPLLALLALLLITIATTASTVSTFTHLDQTAFFYQQQDALISDLNTLQATRIYSDYWTCNRLIFGSQEHILCNSLNPQLTPGQDRYPSYHTLVNGTPQPSYVFQINSPQARALEQLLATQHIPYQRTTSHGYLIYTPARHISLPT